MSKKIIDGESFDFLNGGRVIRLSPIDAELSVTEFDFPPSPALQSSVAEFEAAGFTSISPMVGLTAMKSRAPFLSGHKFHFPKPRFILETQVPVNELQVQVEFDEQTGDVIGWALVGDGNSNSVDLLAQQLPFARLETPLIARQQDLAFGRVDGKPFVKSFAPGVKKIIQLFSIPKLEKLIGSALIPAVSLIDKKIVPHERLQWFDKTMTLPDVTADEKIAMAGKRVLLFVHGIISSSKGAFDALTESNEGFCWQTLSDAYGGRVLAYDHWTLSKSTFENAQHLLTLLPDNITIDVICHSRGAGVVRSLLESDALKAKCEAKNLKFDKVCFVAGACEGSALAKPEMVDRLFKTHAAINRLLSPSAKLSAGVWSQIVKLIFRGFQELPGTDCLNPEGDWINKLKASQYTRANHYYYIRANFDAKNTIVNVVDEAFIDRLVFEGLGNDVVVPFEGAGMNQNYLDGVVNKTNLIEFGDESDAQSEVWHITFFASNKVQKKLTETFVGY
ncbi:DUF7379 domain-containing protein [Shewanella sp. HL-SH2]|uniref:DUF7379 domain-containing protein n=1 Tax=Shewanella sp. HL-SH2 TaxID=3436238 RepID=UPI003EBC57D9